MSGSERFYRAAADLPRLTHEQEIQIGRRALAGNRAARNKLVEHNIRLAHKVAGYYVRRNPTVTKDDLIQAGVEGIIIAAQKYDPAKGTRFSTYAMWYVQKYVRRHIEQTHSRTMTVPSRIAWKYFSGRMNSEEREAYQRTHFESTSLDGAAPGSEGELLANCIPDPSADTEQQALDRHTIERCANKLNALPTIQRTILEKSVGVRSPAQTIDQIAADLSCTTAYVQQQIEQAHAAIQEAANG